MLCPFSAFVPQHLSLVCLSPVFVGIGGGGVKYSFLEKIEQSDFNLEVRAGNLLERESFLVVLTFFFAFLSTVHRPTSASLPLDSLIQGETRQCLCFQVSLARWFA